MIIQKLRKFFEGRLVDEGSPDMSAVKAARLFAAMNHKTVHYFERDPFNNDASTGIIVTDAEISNLHFPFGWYIKQGIFTTDGHCEQISVVLLDGAPVEGEGGYLPRR